MGRWDVVFGNVGYGVPPKLVNIAQQMKLMDGVFDRAGRAIENMADPMPLWRGRV